MGFFDNLWDGAVIDKETLKHIRKTAKELSERMEWLYSSSNDSKLVSIKVNEILADFKNKASDQAVTLEDRLSDVCEEVFENLMDHVEKLNSKDFCGGTLNIPTRKIRSDNRRILRGIRGALEKEVISKVSAVNLECLQILAISWGEERKEKMLDFVNQSLIDSVTKLKQNLICDVQDNIKYVKGQIEIGFDDLKENVKSNLDSLKLLKKGIKNIKESEKNQISVAFDLWKAQYVYQLSKEMQKQ